MSGSTEVSTLALAVLGLLAREPCSAYDIRKIFDTTPMGHFSSSPGAIYPALKRLEASGWIRGRTANADTLRPKRVYRLTREGRRVLTDRVSRDITPEDAQRNLDDVMLRFVFMDKLLVRDRVVELLERFESVVESRLASLQALLDAVRDQLSVCEELSMEHGIATAIMNLAWARKARARLSAAPGQEV
jgi:DNA-binding PadR family transcriptional regulator